jgi:signal transduction histidine kinase
MKVGNDICELLTGPWMRTLLHWPRMVRVGLCVSCFILCMMLYLVIFPLSWHCYIFLALPMLLFAWSFGKYGAIYCFAGTSIVLVTQITFLSSGSFWSPAQFFSFLGTVVVLFLEGCTMVSLRGLWIAAEAANLEAERIRKQLNEAYEQQKLLNQLKDQFILNVNHELRTPLTAAYGYLELMQVLLEEQGHLERETHGEYLKNALNCCDELCSLVNNVLDIMAIGSEKGQLELDMLDVHKMVNEILEHFYMQWQFKHRVQVNIAESLKVCANIQCLRHILYNLLSNAFKYSPSESLVIIEAIFDAASGQVRVGIKDEGPGIPSSEIPLLFGQFVRLQRDLAGSVRGTGLGLYISKYLVEIMKGQIWVESSGIPGQGSCFYFTLPSVSSPS